MLRNLKTGWRFYKMTRDYKKKQMEVLELKMQNWT